ncbi:MAG: YfjI family protein [Alphaproteobacteria bacterium]|nr:YfjI family protein [Alphaproteobacteria bacterium]
MSAPTVIDCISARVAPMRQAPTQEPLPLIPPTIAAPDYPLDALGDVLGDAARAIAAIVQCPPALAAQSVLAAASLAAQGHADVMHPMGKAIPISLMLVTVAESGERKSTADALALEGIEEAARDAEHCYKIAYSSWLNARDANDAARAAAKKKGKDRDAIRDALDAIGADPPAPLHPRRVVSDPNYEGLLRHMQTAHGSLGWFNNEAGQSVGGTALHDDNKLKFGAGLSKLWDGQAVDRVRAGDGVHVLRGRRLTTHLMLQPGVAHILLSDPLLRAQGLFSRTLTCEPVSTIGQRPFRAPLEANRVILARYHVRIGELIEMECAHADAPNELTPLALELSADALNVWTAFHDAVEATLAVGGKLEGLRGFGAKLAENVLRIAGVIAVVERAETIDEEYMRRAVKLGDYYAGEAVRGAERAAIGADMALAEKARLWLTDATRWEASTVTLRQFMQSAPNRARRPKAKAETIIAILVEHGWLTPNGDGDSYTIEGRDA